MDMMGFGYRLHPSYNGYDGVGGKGIDKMIDQLITGMTNYRRYRLKGGCYFFTVALAERKGQFLIEHIEGLHAAFRVPA